MGLKYHLILTLLSVGVSFAIQRPDATPLADGTRNHDPLLLKVLRNASKPLCLHQTPIAIVAVIYTGRGKGKREREEREERRGREEVRK